MRAFTVSDAGSRILDAIEGKQPLPANHHSLTDSLVKAGAIHPTPRSTPSLADVTVVIPAYVRSEQDSQRLQTLVSELKGMYVVVVDDASPHPLSISTSSNVSVTRHSTNSGPGEARNTGLSLVNTSFVAFVDMDASPTPEQLQTLAAYAALAHASLVAPRIVSAPTTSMVGRYEDLRSPLDLGANPSLARPGARVSYVPSTVLVGRTETIRTLGKFNASLRFGEDVDLSWRFADLDSPCRYVPEVEVPHESRATLRELVQQRFGYGTSAAALDQLRPRAVAPMRATIDVALTALFLASGYIATGVVLALISVALTAHGLRKTKLGFNMRLSLAWRGLGHALTLLSRAVTRVWWPVVMLLALFSARASVLLVICTLVPIMGGVLRQKPANPFSYALLRIVDDLSYCAGVWIGAIRTRSIRCMLPVVSWRRVRAH
jgi:mycofactocin system glycosyltransferase